MEIPPPQRKAIQVSTSVIKVAQTGVHKPRSRNIPAPAPIRCGRIRENGGASVRCPNPNQSRNAATTTRCRIRPLPGQLFGNAEKRRCKNTPLFVSSLGVSVKGSKGPNEALDLRLLGDLEFDNSPFQADRDRMSAVPCAELREYVRDVALHACFADRQVVGDLFVGVSASD
jgi:hypothetical protein